MRFLVCEDLFQSQGIGVCTRVCSAAGVVVVLDHRVDVVMLDRRRQVHPYLPPELLRRRLA